MCLLSGSCVGHSLQLIADCCLGRRAATNSSALGCVDCLYLARLFRVGSGSRGFLVPAARLGGLVGPLASHFAGWAGWSASQSPFTAVPLPPQVPGTFECWSSGAKPPLALLILGRCRSVALSGGCISSRAAPRRRAAEEEAAAAAAQIPPPPATTKCRQPPPRPLNYKPDTNGYLCFKRSCRQRTGSVRVVPSRWAGRTHGDKPHCHFCGKKAPQHVQDEQRAACERAAKDPHPQQAQ